eukprot:TRINITY_DN1934_c0_g1_i2.p2 TRINITY_DN1934_c0_g1~~TRINITY_DN1934_c0_g1_i2.p2  ORF type:complete len:121 (-),score=15.84 TRINITY_DN1934_c0_g1_i2:4-366(-)
MKESGKQQTSTYNTSSAFGGNGESESNGMKDKNNSHSELRSGHFFGNDKRTLQETLTDKISCSLGQKKPTSSHRQMRRIKRLRCRWWGTTWHCVQIVLVQREKQKMRKMVLTGKAEGLNE